MYLLHYVNISCTKNSMAEMCLHSQIQGRNMGYKHITNHEEMAIQLGFLQIQGRNMAINMLSTMKKWLYNLIFYSKVAA
jgi:hypothetical protein